MALTIGGGVSQTQVNLPSTDTSRPFPTNYSPKKELGHQGSQSKKPTATTIIIYLPGITGVVLGNPNGR